MPSRWYRSLYWRIAIGFVLCLAAMLVVQAVLFVWVVEQEGPTLPGQPPDRFAQTLALDLAQAISRDPSFDVARYVREHNVPINRLHAEGFPSVGCQPCTRAVQPGENPRAGRWWWEHEEKKECGLHMNPNREGKAA